MIILSKHAVASFCSFDKFLHVSLCMSVINSSIKAGWSALHLGLVPYWFSWSSPRHFAWWVAAFGQKNFSMRLKSTSKLFITRNLFICELFCNLGSIMTSNCFHLFSGIEVYMLAFSIVLWIFSIVLLNLSVL